MHTEWFNEVRYGLFIHWGAYSVAGRGEWVLNRERVPKAEYHEKYVENFKAENFDPADWAAKAKRWGMRYTVLTTRHHDGFALWDSKVNPWNAKNYGPRRDLVAEYVKAVRDAGLKVGVYYSPASWTHPDYPGPFYRDWPGLNDWKDDAARLRYIEYYRAELRELLTGYGKIDYLWFDGCIPENIDGDETLKMVRELQPGIIVNNRLGGPFDVKNCEQAINPPKEDIDWEACMTLNANWGFHAGDHRWKQPIDVIDLLLQCASDGGNLLLNVGPRSDGTIPEESVRILDEVGEWLSKNREAIEFTQRHPFSFDCNARPVTRRANKLYFASLVDPPDGKCCWAHMKNRVKRAWHLADGSPVAFTQTEDRLFLEGIRKFDPATIVALELDGDPIPLISRTSFWIPN